jgi:hypothetical protein
MRYQVASDGEQSEIVGQARRYIATVKLHAVELGAVRTVCEQPIVRLWTMADWEGSVEEALRCGACVEATKDELPLVEVSDLDLRK